MDQKVENLKKLNSSFFFAKMCLKKNVFVMAQPDNSSYNLVQLIPNFITIIKILTIPFKTSVQKKTKLLRKH